MLSISSIIWPVMIFSPLILAVFAFIRGFRLYILHKSCTVPVMALCSEDGKGLAGKDYLTFSYHFKGELYSVTEKVSARESELTHGGAVRLLIDPSDPVSFRRESSVYDGTEALFLVGCVSTGLFVMDLMFYIFYIG